MNNDSSTIIDRYGNLKFWLFIALDSSVPFVLDFEEKDSLHVHRFLKA